MNLQIRIYELRRQKILYTNFLNAMKKEGITFKQIGKLLGYRYQTVSSIVNGETRKGFYYEDACKIRRELFPGYAMDYLFRRE